MNTEKLEYDDAVLLLDSKHYETMQTNISLHHYNAYDDKGNKIEGEYIVLEKREDDKD